MHYQCSALCALTIFHLAVCITGCVMHYQCALQGVPPCMQCITCVRCIITGRALPVFRLVCITGCVMCHYWVFPLVQCALPGVCQERTDAARRLCFPDYQYNARHKIQCIAKYNLTHKIQCNVQNTMQCTKYNVSHKIQYNTQNTM